MSEGSNKFYVCVLQAIPKKFGVKSVRGSLNPLGWVTAFLKCLKDHVANARLFIDLFNRFRRIVPTIPVMFKDLIIESHNISIVPKYIPCCCKLPARQLVPLRCMPSMNTTVILFSTSSFAPFYDSFVVLALTQLKAVKIRPCWPKLRPP